MSGNGGNRLSPTVDKTGAVPYGTLQVIGIYKEPVLDAQAVLSVSGELNPIRRNISVNCPVTLDIANGLYGKSPDEFRKFKDRLKQGQSTRKENQPDTSCDIALLSGVPKSLQDVHLMRHACRLYSISSLQTPAAAAAAAGVPNQPSSTAFEAAVARLSAKVGSDICKPQSRSRESFLLPRSSVLKPAPPAAETPDMDCYYVETGSLELQKVEARGEVTSIEDTYSNEDQHAKAIGFKGTTPQGKSDVDKPVQRNATPSGIKDGVYINDLKHKEAENRAKETVPTPPPPAVPPPRAVELPPELREDYQGEYVLPVETETRVALPIASGSARKVSKKESVSALPPAEKTRPSKQVKRKSVFSSLKEKLANALPKKASLGATKSTTTPKAVFPEEDEVAEVYEELDFVEKPEEDLRKPEAKETEKEDSDSEENYEYPEEDYRWRTLSEVPRDMKNFSISDVSLCLRLLNFGKYMTPFRERNVDGALLRKLDKKTLVQMFQMQEFEAKQLVTFARDNWRPKI